MSCDTSGLRELDLDPVEAVFNGVLSFDSDVAGVGESASSNASAKVCRAAVRTRSSRSESAGRIIVGSSAGNA